jgi:FlaA1/EpsC-like NDP-sugar epimerase
MADLLGRHEIDTDIASIAGYVTGKRVLVTGAGGSIGSELCRQVYRFAPSELIMLDRDESALHAAALKHLPLLEMHPCEALKTNVWGTQHVLDAAMATDVDRFVNISTDKVADPTSVLGYTKRIAERITAHAATRGAGTYLSVRFGNVLGSSGSVLVAFQS